MILIMDSKFQKRKKMILIIDSKFQKRKGKENEKENSLPSVKKHGPKWNSLKCIFNTPFGTK